MRRILIVAVALLWTSISMANEILPGHDSGLQPRGVVRATEQATIAIEFSAPVRNIAYREGQSFAKGAKLIEFDCRKQKAEHTAAAAVRREAELTLKSNEYLRNRGAIGKFDIQVARTRLAKAAADAEVLQLRLEQCEVVAPFDGSIVELSIFEFELPTPGKPFLKILGARAPEIELIVPSHWLVWLRSGTPFQFSVEETATTYPAHVKRIATAVDPVSQTVKIFGTFDKAEGVLAGMSGTATFPGQQVAQE